MPPRENKFYHINISLRPGILAIGQTQALRKVVIHFFSVNLLKSPVFRRKRVKFFSSPIIKKLFSAF